jgi:HAMP domain-containing protein
VNLFVKFNLILLLVFGVALVPAAYLSNQLLQSNARNQVIQNARIMMQSALATRTYTSQQIVSLLAKQAQDDFIPQTVPSYSATEVFNTVRKSNPEYTYKEATLNPTNLRDRTNDWEADVVNAFRADPKLTEIIGERDSARGRSLHLARPIQINDAACLSCHSTADAAPKPVVKTYGPNNGFGWQLHEIVGAQIVSVPMGVAEGMASKALTAILGTVLAVFASMFVFLNILLWFVVIRPIKKLSAMADQVSSGNLEADEVTVGGSDEVAVLAGSFNRMRISLAKALNLLEESGG